MALNDLDIVKLSALTFREREKLDMGIGTICSTFLLSIIVIIAQLGVLYYLGSDMTDILFCGDVVRFIASGEGTSEMFFKKNGADTHRKYKDLWETNFTTQAN